MNDGNHIIIIYHLLNNIVRTKSINRLLSVLLHRNMLGTKEFYRIKMGIVR